MWQIGTLSNYCANLSSNLSHSVLPHNIFFFLIFGILFYENCSGIADREGTGVKTDVQSHSRNGAQHRATLKSSSVCVQGLNQQVGEK